ncbi:Flp family type IVb pilin [Phaeospirillum tilakii]|uniref:Flp family type IVb pilin n=1 Tax=Phaeospirillum tilakii TaxID=741673 RepID=A0ABW5CB77_9PROT
MKRLFAKLSRDENGVAALEYSLLVGLITLVVAAALNTGTISKDLKTIFTNLSTDITTAATASTK